MICSKIVNFDRKEASLTSKWSRILPTVQWCYQNLSNFTIQQCTTSPKTWYRHTYIHRHTHIHRDFKRLIERGCPRLKWKQLQYRNFATPGSILDSQLSWKSGKFQLARWNHRVAKLCGEPHPPTRPPNHPPTALLEFVNKEWLINVFRLSFACL